MSEEVDQPGGPVGDAPSEAPTSLGPPELGVPERRVLGVLVEKSLTVPDSYPLTLNSLVTGCNQKSNRDPVLSLDEDDVSSALSALARRTLVMAVRPETGYATRWRHELTKAMGLQVREQAVLAELLLRGPQTVGELRTRASRMREFKDLQEVEDSLARLEDRRPQLAVKIPPAPGSRAARHADTLRPAAEVSSLRAASPTDGRTAGGESAVAASPPPSSRPLGDTEVARERLSGTEAPATAVLSDRVAELERRVRRLEDELGLGGDGAAAGAADAD